MGDFLRKCKANACRVLDTRLGNSLASLVLLVVVLLLLISLLVTPGILVALALLGLFVCALLYC